MPCYMPQAVVLYFEHTVIVASTIHIAYRLQAHVLNWLSWSIIAAYNGLS